MNIPLQIRQYRITKEGQKKITILGGIKRTLHNIANLFTDGWMVTVGEETEIVSDIAFLVDGTIRDFKAIPNEERENKVVMSISQKVN